MHVHVCMYVYTYDHNQATIIIYAKSQAQMPTAFAQPMRL